jgi:hypothetical protein
VWGFWNLCSKWSLEITQLVGFATSDASIHRFRRPKNNTEEVKRHFVRGLVTNKWAWNPEDRQCVEHSWCVFRFGWNVYIMDCFITRGTRQLTVANIT